MTYKLTNISNMVLGIMVSNEGLKQVNVMPASNIVVETITRQMYCLMDPARGHLKFERLEV